MRMTETAPHKNKLFELVDKAPFAGKFTVKDAYIGFLTSPDEHKTRRAVGSAAFMAFMVAAHAYQAKIGIDSLSYHAPEAIENPTAHDIIYAGIDGMYAAAMGAVTARQSDILRKIGQGYYQWRKDRKTIPEQERKVDKIPYKHKLGAVALALGATLAGQIAEGVSYVDAQIGEYQEAQEQRYQDLRDYSQDMYETNTVYIVPGDQPTHQTK